MYFIINTSGTIFFKLAYVINLTIVTEVPFKNIPVEKPSETGLGGLMKGWLARAVTSIVKATSTP